MIPRSNSTISIYGQESGPKYEVIPRHFLEQRSCELDLFYSSSGPHCGSHLAIQEFLFFSQPQDAWVSISTCRMIGPSASHHDCPRGDTAFIRFLLPTQWDLFGEERQSLLPVGSQLADGCGRQALTASGKDFFDTDCPGDVLASLPHSSYCSLAYNGHWAADHLKGGLFLICLSPRGLSTSAA